MTKIFKACALFIIVGGILLALSGKVPITIEIAILCFMFAIVIPLSCTHDLLEDIKKKK
jgi:hypothetical protein